MTGLLCATDADGEIQKGSLGFYTKEHLEEHFPDCDIIELDTDRVPKGAGEGKYLVSDGSFVKKSAAKIKKIDEDLAKAALPPLHDEFMALDVSGESDAVKLIYNFIKAQHGGL